MLYVALGDSITAGESATSSAAAYPSLIVRGLAQRRNPRASGVVENAVLAEPGWTGQELMSALRIQTPSVLTRADYVTVWVGGDNLIAAGLSMLDGGGMRALPATLANYGVALSSILAWVKSQSKGNLIVCTQYNPFPNSPIAVTGIGALNRTIAEVASRQGAQIAPVHAWFEGNQSTWIAGYRSGTLRDVLGGHGAPVHPNNLGHRGIANGLLGIM